MKDRSSEQVVGRCAIPATVWSQDVQINQSGAETAWFTRVSLDVPLAINVWMGRPTALAGTIQAGVYESDDSIPGAAIIRSEIQPMTNILQDVALEETILEPGIYFVVFAGSNDVTWTTRLIGLMTPTGHVGWHQLNAFPLPDVAAASPFDDYTFHQTVGRR